MDLNSVGATPCTSRVAPGAVPGWTPSHPWAGSARFGGTTAHLRKAIRGLRRPDQRYAGKRQIAPVRLR